VRLKCKCGTLLTTDLFLTKKWHINNLFDYYGDGEHKREYSIRKGSFIRFKWWGDEYLCVHPEDVLDCKDQFKYQVGTGCCGVNGVLRCPCCADEIGDIALDCYQDKSICFSERKVERVYQHC
jgi:hypothetical protein